MRKIRVQRKIKKGKEEEEREEDVEMVDVSGVSPGLFGGGEGITLAMRPAKSKSLITAAIYFPSGVR